MNAGIAKKDVLEAEARAAAAEAASDARAEVREQAAKGAAAVTKRDKADKSASNAAMAKWHDFTVDVWITPFNSIEFGFWKKDRNKGKPAPVFWQQQRLRLGDRFGYAVAQTYAERKLLPSEAQDLTGFSRATFSKYANGMLRRMRKAGQ